MIITNKKIEIKKLIIILAVTMLTAVFAMAEDKDGDTSTNTIGAKSDTKNMEVKLFTQVGAIESRSGNKFMLRRKNSHTEFFTNDETRIYKKEPASADTVEKGYFILVKGPKNDSVILANSIYIFKDWGTYKDTKEKKKILKSKFRKNFSGVLRGTVIKKWSDSDEIEQLKNKIKNEGKSAEALREEAEQRAEDEAEEAETMEGMTEEEQSTMLEEKKKEEEAKYRARPFYIKLSNGKVYQVSHDVNTYWVKTEKSNKDEMKIGDRVELFFNKRVTIRYKSFPVKIIINKVKIGY